MCEERTRRWLAYDYRALRATITSSYPTGLWIGVSNGRIVRTSAYLASVMEAARLDGNKNILWVQAGVHYRETIVVERAHDFDDECFGYMVALQTLEEHQAAFAQWDRDRDKKYLTTAEVVAKLK